MAERVIRLPDVGEGIAEAELVEWHVKIGDLVRTDAMLGAVMTDKATVEIPSPVDGEVVWLGAEIGDKVGEIGRLEQRQRARVDLEDPDALGASLDPGGIGLKREIGALPFAALHLQVLCAQVCGDLRLLHRSLHGGAHSCRASDNGRASLSDESQRRPDRGPGG